MTILKNILAIFVICIPLFAKVGIKAGPVVSDIVFAVEGQIPYLGYGTNSLIHKLPHITYQFGVFKQYHLTNKFDIHAEILLSKKGLNYSSQFAYDDIKFFLNIYYLEIPVLLKYCFGDRKAWSFLLGPYGAYAIDNVLIIHSNDYNDKTKLENVNQFDFGISAGLERVMTYRNNNIIFDFRFSYSLLNMMKYADEFTPEYYGPVEERAKNVNLGFTIGYLLNVGNDK